LNVKTQGGVQFRAIVVRLTRIFGARCFCVYIC